MESRMTGHRKNYRLTAISKRSNDDELLMTAGGLFQLALVTISNAVSAANFGIAQLKVGSKKIRDEINSGINQLRMRIDPVAQIGASPSSIRLHY